MNHSAMAFLANDDVIAVQCVFPSGDVLKEDKRYTYKSLDTTLKVGDLVVVQGSTQSGFGYIVVKVADIDVAIDVQNSIAYKWVVSKLDLSDLDTTLEAEKSLVKEVKRLEMQANRAKLREALGITTDSSFRKISSYKDKVDPTKSK